MAIFGMSCPSTGLCLAVGGNNAVASSTDPTGDASGWNVVYPGKGAIATEPNGFFNGRQVRSVSCPSSALCVAVTFEGHVYTATDPTGAASAWSDTDTGGGGSNTHFSGVSCPTPSLCVAVSQDGKVATSTDPTGGAAAWSTVQLSSSLRLRDVSCATASLCVAVGGEEVGGAGFAEGKVFSKILYSTDPTGGAAAWTMTETPVGSGDLFGISCVVPSLCVTGNTGGNLLVSTGPTSPAPNWALLGEPGSVQITAVSCPTASHCLAVDNNGDVLASTDPTGGAADWTFTNIAPYVDKEGELNPNAMFGVSCPTVTLCAAGGAKGQVYVSANPFTESGARVTQGSKKVTRPRRPRVTIALSPPPGLRARPGGLTVRYRFFARHHAKVKGFVCKLGMAPFRPCRSPRRYRHVGAGKHVFRVRAVGLTGLRGPITRDTFTVKPPCSHAACQGRRHAHRSRSLRDQRLAHAPARPQTLLANEPALADGPNP